jgi:hypothetical protein
MKEVLEETHGVMVYQEQVMRILERLGGIELSRPTPASRRSARRSTRSSLPSASSLLRVPRRRAWEAKRLRNSVWADREVCRLRLQQEPLHGLRPAGLADGLPQDALCGSSWRPCSRAIFRAATSKRRIQSSSTSKTADGWRSPSAARHQSLGR